MGSERHCHCLDECAASLNVGLGQHRGLIVASAELHLHVAGRCACGHLHTHRHVQRHIRHADRRHTHIQHGHIGGLCGAADHTGQHWRLPLCQQRKHVGRRPHGARRIPPIAHQHNPVDRRQGCRWLGRIGKDSSQSAADIGAPISNHKGIAYPGKWSDFEELLREQCRTLFEHRPHDVNPRAGANVGERHSQPASSSCIGGEQFHIGFGAAAAEIQSSLCQPLPHDVKRPAARMPLARKERRDLRDEIGHPGLFEPLAHRLLRGFSHSPEAVALAGGIARDRLEAVNRRDRREEFSGHVVLGPRFEARVERSGNEQRLVGRQRRIVHGHARGIVDEHDHAAQPRERFCEDDVWSEGKQGHCS